MAWTTDLTLMTRVLINDIDSPQKYDDTYLQRTIVTAGILVNVEVELPYIYTFDVNNIIISPDPIDMSDSVSQSLLPLKSSCILTIGEFKKALGQGIKVRDGDSSVDTSVSFGGYRDILEFGPCKAYEKLKWQINAGGILNGGVGAVVFGPYRQSGSGSLNDTIRWYYDSIATLLQGRA